MTKRIVWLVVSCLMVAALLLATCAPAVVEHEEEVARPEEEEEVVTEEEAAPEEEVVAEEEAAPEEEVVTEEEVAPTTTSTDTVRLQNLVLLHDELFKRTEEDYQEGRKPISTTDEQGNVVTRWNFFAGVLETVEKKMGDDWTTTAYRSRRPLITVYGKADVDALRDAYDEIIGDAYDFTENRANVAFILLYVSQGEWMNVSALQRMLANPTISTEHLADILEEVTGRPAAAAMVIGYTNTTNPNDGNRIYASIIWMFSYGILGQQHYFDDPNPTG